MAQGQGQRSSAGPALGSSRDLAIGPADTDHPLGGMGMQHALAGLASIRFEEETLESTLAVLVSLASRVLSRADGIDLMVVRSSTVGAVGASTEQCRRLNIVQSESGRGPSLLAIGEALTIEVGVGSSREVWPEFTEAASDRGFEAVLAIPLMTGVRVLGALSLFTQRAEGFDDGTRHRAQILGDWIAIALDNATAFATVSLINQQLQEALKSREVIGTAKGLLMERHGCAEEEAFDLLRQESQQKNLKLRDVAKNLTVSMKA